MRGALDFSGNTEEALVVVVIRAFCAVLELDHILGNDFVIHLHRAVALFDAAGHREDASSKNQCKQYLFHNLRFYG